MQGISGGGCASRTAVLRELPPRVGQLARPLLLQRALRGRAVRLVADRGADIHLRHADDAHLRARMHACMQLTLTPCKHQLTSHRLSPLDMRVPLFMQQRMQHQAGDGQHPGRVPSRAAVSIGSVAEGCGSGATHLLLLALEIGADGRERGRLGAQQLLCALGRLHHLQRLVVQLLRARGMASQIRRTQDGPTLRWPSATGSGKAQ